MEGIISAITLDTTAAQLSPYLSDSALIAQWLGILPTPGARHTRHHELFNLPLLQESIESEYWVNERRQLFVISMPPPARRPTYFLECNHNGSGVHLLVIANLPDTTSTDVLTEYKQMMTGALERLRKLVERPPASHQE